MRALIAIEPPPTGLTSRLDRDAADARYARLAGAVEAGGGRVVPVAAATGVVWMSPVGAGELARLLDAHPAVSWVQLPWAGVEEFLTARIARPSVAVTSAKALFAEQVAEHALLLVLAGFRNVVRQCRTRGWREAEPASLAGRQVTVLGGGGVANAFVRLLEPFRCTVRVVRRRADLPVPGAKETLPPTALHSILPETEVLVLALALTPSTRGLIGPAELELLPARAVIVNVARGQHIVTDALVASLASGHIAAAGLDVTDPEPLPADHPLWFRDNVMITSHCADSVDFVTEQLGIRVQENVARFAEGKPLAGLVDAAAGY